MIIQHRQDQTLRIITQHDHGLLSGLIAHHWRRGDEPLSHALTLAITLHDLAWVQADDPQRYAAASALPFDQARHQAHDFITLSSEHKAQIYAHGIDALAQIDLYATLLISLHYSAFMPAKPEYEAFLAHEQARRAQLCARLGLRDDRDPQLLADFELLKTLDMISLYACQAAPGSSLEGLPAWLKPRWSALGEPYTFDFAATQGHDEPDTLVIGGAQLNAPILTSVPFRQLEAKAYEPAGFLAAWREAEERRWTLRIVDQRWS